MSNILDNQIQHVKALSECNLDRVDENVIALTLFGSYNTRYWNEDRSDIDILVLMKYSDFSLEYKVEEYYRPVLSQYFAFEDIHFTFIALNSFDSVFGDIYIDFQDKIIFDMEQHYDFLMYINKFYRVNEYLITLVRKDWESKYGVL